MSLVLYHGTIREDLPRILKAGLRRTGGWGGYGQEGVFLTDSVEQAEYWAKWNYMRAGVDRDGETWTGGGPEHFDRMGISMDEIVVLRVTLPDEVTPMLQADMEQAEDYAFEGGEDDWQDALRAYGSVCFPQPIPPEWISVE